MANQDFSRQIKADLSGFSRSKNVLAKLHLDLVLLLLLILVCAGGLIILYSASGQNTGLLVRQLIHYAIGFCALFAAAQIPPRIYRMIAPWGYLLAVSTLLGVLLIGVGAKGAQRWLELPGLPRFQPSEIAKLVLPLTVAWYMAKRPTPPPLLDLIKAAVIIAIPVLLIVKQPDLGTSILVSAAGLMVLFFAGARWRIIVSMIALVAAVAPLMWMFVMREYQKQRVLTFLNPESDPLGSGWNIIQSKIAIGSGGIEGKGYLLGTQSQLEFLPESHTDFIIAVLAEETGLVGVSLLLAGYFMVIWRCLAISSRCASLFARLLSGSLTITFFIYVFVNIGMVSGLLPVVGVPLPLISYGGTSVVSLLIAFGVIMSMYTHQRH